MALPALTALWFLPFVLPLCAHVVYTDLSKMKIANRTVMALAGVYALVGIVAMPSWEAYVWGFVQLALVLGAGFILNLAGAMGAGDAKFLAAAAPYIAPGDLGLLIPLFMGLLLAAVAAHRIARATALRRLAPDWKSWKSGRRFPMGLALGPVLATYLALAALNGA